MNLTETQDVLIIGGGIIGLSTARALKRRSVEKVLIVEKNSVCGAEASSAAAGILAPQAEADCADEFFEFCRASRNSYPRFAKELFAETGVDIELDRTGTLYLAFTERDAEELEKRFAWQAAANLQVEKLSAKEILEIEPNVSPDVLFGLLFPCDWQVENRKIIEALNARLIRLDGNKSLRRGGAADKTPTRNRAGFTTAAVESLIFENDKITGARTNRGNIFAEKIIVASGAWTSLIKDEFGLLARLRISPVRGQMIVFNDVAKLFRRVIYTARGYVVPRRDGRILVGATVERVGFDCRTTDAGTASLLAAAFEISPAFAKLRIKKAWANLRPVSADGLPIVGEFCENLFIAAAHYRNGILLAPKTSEILADKITGVSDSEFSETFSPRRFARQTETI